MLPGSHTGDRKLDDNAWSWWPVSSTLVVYGQVLVALDSQDWSTVKFGGHVVGYEAEVAV